MSLYLPVPPPQYDQRTENVRNSVLQQEDARNAKLNTNVLFGNVQVLRTSQAAANEVVRGDDPRFALALGGTVTSVGLNAPASLYNVTGTPVTTAGSLTLNLANQAQNAVWAGPVSGGAGLPTFRALQTADMPAGFGTGTVTSVGLAVPAGILSASGTPVTASGTITVSLINQTNNKVFAGPTSIGAAAPTFRALVAADLPVGTGTVTSVSALDLPGGLGTAVVNTSTTTPQITYTATSVSPNVFYAGPATGSSASAPTWRVLNVNDLPAGTPTAFYVNTQRPAAISNTVTETTFNFVTPVVPSIAANSLRVGSIIRIQAWGIYSTSAASPTIRLKMKLGGTIMIDSNAVGALLTSASNAGWHMNALLVVTAIGASGTIEANGVTEFGAASAATQRFLDPNTAVISRPTNVLLQPSMTAQWSAASASNSITLTSMLVEVFG